MIQPKTISGLLEARVLQSPKAVAHWTLDKVGKWQPTTWEQYLQVVSHLAARLQDMGLARGQSVGIMARTSQTWEYIQMAILISGGIVVGIHPPDLDDNVNAIANIAEVVGLVVQNPGLLKKISTEVRSNLDFVVGIDDSANGTEVKNFVLLKDLQKGKPREFDSTSKKPSENDPATIVFTSGTTGTPKGIMYKHEQVTLACNSILEAFNDIEAGSRFICWLPLSNLFQRMINFCAIVIGASTYFVENPHEVVKHLPAVSPHVFIGVPRFFEKLYSGIMDGVSQKPLCQRKLVEWALRVGDLYAGSLRETRTPAFLTQISHWGLDRFVLRRLRQIMGSNLKYMISGSAPMPRWLLEGFHAMGILILEAYGISENIIPVAANRSYAVKFGTVGKPLSGNEIRLGDDGELLVKGPGVFSGYYSGEPKKGALTSDGCLSTGDYAEIDDEGFITLTGRKSEIFKTSTGRRISPVGIEDPIRRISYVEHPVVFGAGKKFLIALLSISTPALLERAKNLGFVPAEDEETIPVTLYDVIRMDINRELAPMPKYQRPAGLLLTSYPFTVDGGELTGNLKLRRKNIEEKFKNHINELYARMEHSEKSKPVSADRAEDIFIHAI